MSDEPLPPQGDDNGEEVEEATGSSSRPSKARSTCCFTSSASTRSTSTTSRSC